MVVDSLERRNVDWELDGGALVLLAYLSFRSMGDAPQLRCCCCSSVDVGRTQRANAASWMTRNGLAGTSSLGARGSLERGGSSRRI